MVDPAWFWLLLGTGLVAVGPALACADEPIAGPPPLDHPAVLAGALVGAGLGGLGSGILYQVYPSELLWASALTGAVLGALATACALWY